MLKKFSQGLETPCQIENQILFEINKDMRITKIRALIRQASIEQLSKQLAKCSRADSLSLTFEHENTLLWRMCVRFNLGFDQHLELDLTLIESQSLCPETQLMLNTVPTVLSTHLTC